MHRPVVFGTYRTDGNAEAAADRVAAIHAWLLARLCGCKEDAVGEAVWLLRAVVEMVHMLELLLNRCWGAAGWEPDGAVGWGEEPGGEGHVGSGGRGFADKTSNGWL